MAACGAKVLHLRCVEYARRFDIPIHVRSSFSQQEGTWVTTAATARRRRPMEAADHRRRRPRPQRGQGHRRRRARQARRGRRDLRGARRRRDQHRHDRAERLGRRRPAAPTSRSRCPRPTASRRSTALRRRSRTRSASSRCSTTTRSARSRWSAPACAPTPASRRRSSRRSPTPGVNIEMISTSEIRISVITRDDQRRRRRCGRCTRRSAWTPTEGEAVVYGGTGR